MAEAEFGAVQSNNGQFFKVGGRSADHSVRTIGCGGEAIDELPQL